MNKALLILLLFLQIGMADGAIEVIGADATWSNVIVSGPNPTVSDRIIVYGGNVLSKFDVTAIPSDLNNRINNIRDRIIIYGANAIDMRNMVDTEPRIIGDVDDDSLITASDALLYLRYAVGQNIAPYHLDESDDVTCDGSIYADDALLVLRRAVGQNVDLECPKP